MYKTYEEFKKTIPKIIIKSAFFNNPKPFAEYRRNMEKYKIKEVKEWLESIDFKVEQVDNNTLRGYYTTIKKKDIKVEFFYKESSKNIYKYFKIYINGLKMNIRSFYKYMKEDLKYIEQRYENINDEKKQVQLTF